MLARDSKLRNISDRTAGLVWILGLIVSLAILPSRFQFNADVPVDWNQVRRASLLRQFHEVGVEVGIVQSSFDTVPTFRPVHRSVAGKAHPIALRLNAISKEMVRNGAKVNSPIALFVTRGAWTTPEFIRLLSVFKEQLIGIDISDLRVTNDMVAAIASCLQLEWIVAENCTITDHHVIQLSKLKKLNVISLRSTNVGDFGVASLANLPQLKQLYLTSTDVTGGALKPLSRCSELAVLEIAHVNIRPIAFSYLQHFGNLRSLTLFGTPAADSDLQHIEHMHHLQTLDIGLTRISDAGIKSLMNLSNLRVLRLHHMKNITDQAVCRLRKCHRLVELSLKGTDITHLGIATVAKQHPHLERLSLGGRAIDKSCLQSIGRLTRLTDLDISWCYFDDPDLSLLSNCIRLQSLYLSVSELGPSIAVVCRFTCLRHLDLSRTNLTDRSLTLIVRSTKQLIELNLFDCRLIGDDSMRSLAFCRSLQRLTLHGTSVTDTGLLELRHLPGLRRVGVSDTNVTAAGIRRLNRLAPHIQVFAD